MTKITYAELKRRMKEFNNENNVTTKGSSKNYLLGVVVFTKDSFEELYPLESRSYRFSNYNKAFISGMCGYSIYGGAIDGSDECVRLEQYIEDEGRGNWKIDYCYIEGE